NRRLIVTTTEAIMNAMKIWDATDLQKPVQIAYWTRKAGPEILDNEHNINIVDGRLYMAHYSFGVFVFDLNKLPGTPSAPIVGIQPVAHYAGTDNRPPT